MTESQIVLFSLTKSEIHEIVKSAVDQALTEQQKQNQKEILSSSELCNWLGISNSTLSKWKREHRIPYSRNGKRIFFNREHVKEALKESNYSKLRNLN